MGAGEAGGERKRAQWSAELHEVVGGPKRAGSLGGCGPGWDAGTSDVSGAAVLLMVGWGRFTLLQRQREKLEKHSCQAEVEEI